MLLRQRKMADEREPEAGPSTRAATLLPPSNIAQYDPTSTSEDEADDSDRNPPTTYSPKKRKSSGNLRSQTINYDTGYTPPPLPGHDLPDFSILSASNHPAQYAPNSLPYPSTSSVTSHGAAPLVMVDEEDKEKGRRKIQIEYIEEKSKRHITFSKRKAGIMKKVSPVTLPLSIRTISCCCYFRFDFVLTLPRPSAYPPHPHRLTNCRRSLERKSSSSSCPNPAGSTLSPPINSSRSSRRMSLGTSRRARN